MGQPAPLDALLDCDSAAGNPDPATDPNGYRQRDLANVLCSNQRLFDEYTNPAFFLKFQVDETPRTYSDNVLDQLREPTRPRLTLGQWIPGGRTADPYRVPEDWQQAGRGRFTEISFIASDGAKLPGRIFTPNACAATGCPAVVITTGSIQGYQELYNWASEGLAEAGYMVLAYDVQGQGRGETFPHNPDGSIACDASGCTGVPFQQDYNFYQGTRDALDFLFSTPDAPYAHAVGTNAVGSNEFNPLWQDLDREHVGLAGHSLGASAVSVVGQEDPRVHAIVAWDAARAVDAGDVPSLHAALLSIASEYFLNAEPTDPSKPPSPTGNKDAAFDQLAGTADTMLVFLRASTHLEYSYVPYILPASRKGERVAMYYTLAWFDRYLKGDASAAARLTALSFDDSADRSSIGAGRFDATQIQPGVAGADGNVPYTIAGECVANRLSIYYSSRYSLEGGALTVPDMRARGC